MSFSLFCELGPFLSLRILPLFAVVEPFLDDDDDEEELPNRGIVAEKKGSKVKGQLGSGRGALDSVF